MRYKDIPTNILEEVYKKWKKIYEKGKWDDVYWNECSMCEYIKKKYNSVFGACSECPLYKSDWCNGMGNSSRLAIYSHSSIENWLKDVKRFLDIMKRVLRERKRKVK